MKYEQRVSKIMRLFLAIVVVFVTAVNADIVLADEDEDTVGYVVYHEFVNCQIGEDLPHEILNIVPLARTGYSDGSLVLPTGVVFSELMIVATDMWVFRGWNAPSLEIQAADVVFSGEWCLVSPDELTFDFYFWLYDDNLYESITLSEPIVGALFNLYVHNSESDDWMLMHEDIRSGTDGRVLLPDLRIGNRYKLVQISTAIGFVLPSEYWQLSVRGMGDVEIVHVTARSGLFVLEDGRWFVANLPNDGSDMLDNQLSNTTILILLALLLMALGILVRRILQRDMSHE